jgi:hypothetical protein
VCCAEHRGPQFTRQKPSAVGRRERGSMPEVERIVKRENRGAPIKSCIAVV